MKTTTFAIRTLMATGSVLLFFGCGEPPPESSASGARPVKSIVVAPPTVNMSITIMAGLGFATLLTLFFVPVLYSFMFGAKHTENA